jgi:hypothetical protein
MITLRFLGLVIKFAALTVIAVVIEHAVIGSALGFTIAVVITIGLFALITTGLYREWRARATSHYYQTTTIRGSDRR